jgi:hypothetical protein
MKTLAELKDEVMRGLQVCAPEDEEGNRISYVFRKRGIGSIVYAYCYGPDQYTIYHNVTLIREDEPEYDPSDHQNMLTNCVGPARLPVWQLCTIPEALMTRFLREADEAEEWHKKQRAQLMYAGLRVNRQKQEGRQGIIIEEIPIIPFDQDDDLDSLF